MLIERTDGDPHRVVITDFGLARPLSGPAVLWESRTGGPAGAPFFVAPEVLRGEKTGMEADIYGLGLIIDEMVTRSQCLPSDSVEEVFWRKLHGEPELPSARSEGLPEAWERVILSCLDGDLKPPSEDGRGGAGGA